MWKKTRTCKLYKNHNVVCKHFVSNLKENDLHRKGPINCVCFKDLDTIFNNEVSLLEKLKNYDHFPKITKTIKQKYQIYMTHCGNSLKELKDKKKINKIPRDWPQQIKEISDSLTEQNIYHNDIALTNVCIKKHKIYLIDFGCCQPLDLKLKENFDNRNNSIDLTNLFKNLIKQS